jgi:hypothetical protein
MDQFILAEEGESVLHSEAYSKHMNKDDKIYSKIQVILKRLLLGYIEYYPNNLEESDSDSNFKKSFIWVCFESIIFIFQILSLGQPYLLYQDYINFEWFYTFISLSRPDLILASIAFYTFAFLFHTSLVFILSIVFSLNLYRAIKPSATKRWIILSTLFIDRVFRRYMYIPALVGLLTTIKFNMIPGSKAEYFYSNDISILKHNIISAFSGPLLALSLLHTLFFSLIDNQEKGCYSRSHSRIMLQEKLSIFVCAVCQVFLNENHTIIQVTIQGFIGVYIATCYVKYLPYTYIHMNILKLFTYMSLAVTSFVNLVNSINGSAGTVVLVTIINLPLLYVFSYTIVKWRYRYVNQIPFTKLNCPYLSEIQVREKITELLKLIEEENQEDVKNYKLQIKSMFNFMENTYRNNTLVACWHSIYLFEIEKDEELAKIKLSKVHLLPFSIDGYYLAMRYEYTFKVLSKVYSEQLDYLKFREIYQTVKNQDISICKLQLMFWNELDKPTPNIKKLKKTAINIKKVIDSILKLGDKLIAEYPQNIQALYLYSTFLSDVYNENERGQEMLQKYQFLKSSRVDSFSLFNPRVGIMIISGDGNNTGKIEYLNQEASNILDIPAETAVSLNVAQFLPYPINDYKHHNKCMMNFIKNTPKTRVPLPNNSFIVNQKGFLVNIIFEGKCVAYNSVVFFLAALKRNEDWGESALIGPDGVIQHHTQNFPKLLDMREISLVGYNLLAILPEVEQILRSDKNVMKISLLLRKLWIKFEEIQIKAVTFRLVTLRLEQIDVDDSDSDLSLTYVRQYSKQDVSLAATKLQQDHKVKFAHSLFNKNHKIIPTVDSKTNTHLRSDGINSSTGGASNYSISNSPLDTKMRKTVTSSVRLLKISILVSVTSI